jgi:16S rRNA (adenine1518-N6/adenine1519-N6)-dimethyltransferase
MVAKRDDVFPDAGASQPSGDSPLNLPPLPVAALLRTHGLAPRKSLGQNFLTDPAILRRIVEAAELPPQAEVLEIGPGLGSLTRVLAQVARRVVAVELDHTLIPLLEEVVAPYGNVEVLHGDILKFNPAQLMPAAGCFVVANIPYYITSAVMRHLLEAPVRPQRVVLTVQREVAQRICAEPGEMSLLALSVQVYGTPHIAMRIPAGAFYPPPKVDSAVVRVDLSPQPRIPAGRLEIFFRLIRAGFSQKRKTLRNALSGGLGWTGTRTEALLQQAGIDPNRRAESLALEEWASLVEAYEQLEEGAEKES